MGSRQRVLASLKVQGDRYASGCQIAVGTMEGRGWGLERPVCFLSPLSSRHMQAVGCLCTLLSYFAVGVPLAILFSFRYKLDSVGLALGLCVGCYVFMFTTLLLVLTTNWPKEVDNARARLGIPSLPIYSSTIVTATPEKLEVAAVEVCGLQLTATPTSDSHGGEAGDRLTVATTPPPPQEEKLPSAH